MSAPSLSLLATAREAVLRNAEAILEDSRYLLLDKRVPRSFALTVLAREELAKLAMIVRATYAIKAGNAFDWRRFRKRMKAHRDKVDLFELLGIMLSTNLFRFPDPKVELLRLYQRSSNRRRLDGLKQGALYVSVTSTNVMAPVDGTTESTAWEFLEDTLTFCQFFSSGERESTSQDVFAGITDLYGKMICLAEELIEDPSAVSLPR